MSTDERWQKYARWAVFAGAFSGPLAGNSVLAMVPKLEQQFNLTAPEVLVSISFYMFPFAILSLVSGSISDIYGRRKVITFGFLVYAVGAIVCAFSSDIWTFYISRGIQGFGYAFVNPVLVAILAEVVEPRARARNMGYLGAATTAGVATGPLLAGILSTWDWRYTFLFIGILCILCNIAILRTYTAQGFQPAGDSWTDFLRNIPRGLRNRGVVLISVIGFLNFFCYIGALSYVSDVLSKPPLSLQVGVVGALVAMGGVAGIFAAPAAGRLVDRIGRGVTASLGLVTVFLSTVLLIIASDIPGYAAGIAMLGGGSQMLWAALFTLTVELDPPIKGTVSSIFNCTRFMGYAISPLLLGPIYLSSGFDTVLAIGGCVLLAALAFSIMLRNR